MTSRIHTIFVATFLIACLDSDNAEVDIHIRASALTGDIVMGTTARLEPDYDILDDDFDADSDLDLGYEENLDGYLEIQNTRSGRARRRARAFEDSGHHRLPADWQDFDYSNDDWNSP